MPDLGASAAALVDELADGTRVLGWAEGPHLTAECLGVRNAVIAHLVRDGRLLLIAAETGFARSRAADAYVLGEGPDEPDAATVRGVWSWIRRPLHANGVLLRWLRRHNATVPPERRVRFVGLEMFGNDGIGTLPDGDDERVATELRERLGRHRAAGGNHRDLAVRDGAQYWTLQQVAARFPGEGILVFEQVEHLDRRLVGSLGWHLARAELGRSRVVGGVWRDGEPSVRYPLGRYLDLSRWLGDHRSTLITAPLGTGLLDLRGQPRSEPALADAAAAFDAVHFAPTLTPARSAHPLRDGNGRSAAHP